MKDATNIDAVLWGLGVIFLICILIASVICPVVIFGTEHHDVAVVVTGEQWEYLDQGFPRYRLWVDEITPIQITNDGDNFLIIEFVTRRFEHEKIDEMLRYHVEAYYVID